MHSSQPDLRLLNLAAIMNYFFDKDAVRAAHAFHEKRWEFQKRIKQVDAEFAMQVATGLSDTCLMYVYAI